jgi:hypothetical protein
MFKRLVIALSLIGATQGLAFANSPVILWKLDGNQPITSIEFPMTIYTAQEERRFYYAYQFRFSDKGLIGYIGIQPQDKLGDKTQFRFVFSSFRAESKPQHSNCSLGADGGSGTSCAVILDGTFGTTYKLLVEKNKDIVTGTVIDSSTGKRTIIGKWNVSDTAEYLANKEVAWSENYTMNRPGAVLQCDITGWPYYEVKYEAPSANNGQIKGSLSTINTNKWDDLKTCSDAIFDVKTDGDQSLTLGAGYKK